MNELQIFENPEFGKVRTVSVEDKVYFVANDVAKALGYTVPKDAVTRHCKGALKQRYLTEGGEQEMKVIPEGDVYRLVIKSQLPAAEKFESWIFDEVLPAIRKTGGYITRETSEQIRLEAQKARADAMLLNAKNRAFRTIMSAVEKKNLSPIAVQVFGLKGIEGVFGVDTGNYLPQVEKTYTATEIGKMFGVSAKVIGTIANKNGMKTEEYGITVLDKSKYSAKNVPAFRYNEKAVERFRDLLKGLSAD